jgi:uncharacterized membrane protein YfcA
MDILLGGEQLILLAVLVTAGMTVQTATGFGSNLVIISIGASMMPVQELVSVILPANVLQSLIIVIRQGHLARWSLLTRRVLPLMAIGVILGLGLAYLVAGDWLKAALGAFILAVSVNKLHELFWERAPLVVEEAPDDSAVPAFGLVLAGVFHGLYATAGPMLVWSLARAKLDHLVLRSTLAIIWIAMNAILVAGLMLGGVMRLPHLTLGVLLLPALGLGYLLGEQVQKKLPERKLRGLIYSVLLLAGLSLLYKGIF